MLIQQKNKFSLTVKLIMFLIFVFLINIKVGYATELFATQDNIKNIKKALAHLKKSSIIPVHFPTEINMSEDPHKKLYATLSGKDLDQSWCIWVGSTPDCNGAHNCNIGSLCAEKNADVDNIYQAAPTFKKINKQYVMLADGTY